MGSKERRERERQRLRQRIIAAAEELFAQDGIEEVSMRGIADRIEYSPAALYQHFAGKTEIVEALMQRGYQELARRLAEVEGRDHTSPRHRLCELVRTYIDYGLEHPDRYRLWFSSSVPHRDQACLRLETPTGSFPAFASWLGAIEECIAAGLISVPDSRLAFQAIWAGAHGIVSLLTAYPEYPWVDQDLLIGRMLELVIDGQQTDSKERR